MQIQVHIVNAFIDGHAGGNPAGVVTDANALTASQKLAVAKAVGLSETAFVSASTRATYKLEFFTPTRQIAHCGHATVAAFSLLKQMGLVGDGWCSKETIDGLRDILIDHDMAFMQQRAPTYQAIAQSSETTQRVLASLGLQNKTEQLLNAYTPCVVSTGNSFLLVPMASSAYLKALLPNQAAIQALSEELDLIGYYAFCTTVQLPSRSASTRMFAPRFGITEEAGTGMAAGPLACYLHDVMHIKQTSFLIEQGHLMPQPSPSVIHVNLELDKGQITRLMAGGRAHISSTKQVQI
jgi:PhzF family phenazine biosynthesis protein